MSIATELAPLVSSQQTPTMSHLPPRGLVGGSWLDVSDLASAYGLDLDPWQEYVLRAGLAERRDGAWAASRVGISVPRQNGKTAIFEARELAGLLLFDEKVIIHSAHLMSTCVEAFRRLKSYLDNFDDLRRKVRRVRDANGEQGVEMMDGTRIMFRARGRAQGRGITPDVLMLDEAQILSDSTWGNIMPSTSARPNVQAWLAGTPPTPDDDGEVFTRLRTAAVHGKDERLVWCEWSSSANDDEREREATWAKANPAYGRRIFRQAVSDELYSLGPQAFDRERLGIWAIDAPGTVIPSDRWKACKTDDPLRVGPVSYGVDMSPDRSRVAIAAARKGEDVTHVEVIRYQLARTGTDWVVDFLAERWPNTASVVLDSQGPAISLLPALQARRVNVTVVSTGTDMARACGMLYDAVTGKTLTHFDQPALNAALEAARARDIGSAGGWGWARRDATADICPLVAVTLAHYGARTAKRKPGRTMAVQIL